MSQYVTIILTLAVLLTNPVCDGKRSISKLIGKDLTIMKTLKNREAVITYLG